MTTLGKIGYNADSYINLYEEVILLTDKEKEVMDDEEEMVVVMTDEDGNEYYYREEMIIPVGEEKYALLIGIHEDEEEHEHGCSCLRSLRWLPRTSTCCPRWKRARAAC